MSAERDELAEVIWDEESCDWRQSSPDETVGAILAAGFRKIFDGDFGLSSINDEADREAAEAWMRWANILNTQGDEERNGIAAMKQMLAEFGYKRERAC